MLATLLREKNDQKQGNLDVEKKASDGENKMQQVECIPMPLKGTWTITRGNVTSIVPYMNRVVP